MVAPTIGAQTTGFFNTQAIATCAIDTQRNAPMLVINGADDVHVPQHDTLVFQGRRDTVVELIPGTGHCATSQLPQAMATIADWLERTLAAATAGVAQEILEAYRWLSSPNTPGRGIGRR